MRNLEEDPVLKKTAITAAIAATAALTACSSSSSQTIHGTLMPANPGIANNYAGCALSNPAPGTQIVVTDPSGKVIATTTLGQPMHDHATVNGITLYGCHEPFTLTGVPSEPRYGFQINGIPGTLWVTNLTNVSLTVQ